MTVSPAELVTRRLSERELKVDGVGTIIVRGLSRAEALKIRAFVDDNAAMERAVLLFGVSSPSLTERDVELWYDAAPPGEFEPILAAIQELSGLSEGAPKRGVPPVRGGRRA